MDLGTKLKQARQSRNVTQETLAERLGVSRQTISNWENNRSYPDIVSIIALSDLYGVSLDALLKGDPKMIEHLQQQTNTVKSRRQLFYWSGQGRFWPFGWAAERTPWAIRWRLFTWRCPPPPWFAPRLSAGRKAGRAGARS